MLNEKRYRRRQPITRDRVIGFLWALYAWGVAQSIARKSKMKRRTKLRKLQPAGPAASAMNHE